MSALENLQSLLREPFQLDTADRLFHVKRQEIETRLQQQFPRRVSEGAIRVISHARHAGKAIRP